MIFAIPPRMNHGQDEVAFWDGFLTEEEINFLLAQPEWVQREVGCVGGSGGSAVADSKIRETSVSWIGAKPEMEALWGKLSRVVAEVNRRYFHFDLTGFYEPMQLGV